MKRYPENSVLVPEWTRVSDWLPTADQNITFVITSTWGSKPVVHHGWFQPSDGYPFRSDTGPSFALGRVTHWSPRVGVPLPEDV